MVYRCHLRFQQETFLDVWAPRLAKTTSSLVFVLFLDEPAETMKKRA